MSEQFFANINFLFVRNFVHLVIYLVLVQWTRVVQILSLNNKWASYAKRGAWNDPDMVCTVFFLSISSKFLLFPSFSKKLSLYLQLLKKKRKTELTEVAGRITC